ncbi:hypothetical protein [Bacteroides ovatus]|uniref:hypothetical protein n=1 Tax=Bacteroides ovatus TaxID=28116 RepID=UPI0020A80C96|nr:hypothetical protein [Bacteroides ovatus]CAG9926618.1 hypothetical protein BOVAC16_4401 [Bacteroides ovatus]
MRSILEVVSKLEALRGQIALSTSEKSEIELMYQQVLGKDFVKTSCNDCYRDAVIEMYLYLKRTGNMKEKSNYTLKNGVLLQTEFGSNTMYTNANLTDEVAENYLAKDPKGEIFFASMPTDWEERVKKRFSLEIELNEELINILVDTLKSGATITFIKETFKTYSIDGKKVTAKVLDAHLKAAKDIIVNDAPKDDSENSQTEE